MISKFLHSLRNTSPRKKFLTLTLLLLCSVLTIKLTIGQPTPPNIPLVDLAEEPLYLNGAKTKPAVVLALSVEFPTAGAAYAGNGAYALTSEYVGYFDPNGCYKYNQIKSRFERYGQANLRTCGGQGFSGNFMNWASASAIDILRYGLTGGDRVVDDETETVLQRAVLPRRNDMYGGGGGAYFPTKSVSGTVAAVVMPLNVLGAASTSTFTATVNITNCLNQIHFGVGTATGGTGDPERFCRTPGTNASYGNITSTVAIVTNTALPSGFSQCATEGGTCLIDGLKQVVYSQPAAPFNHQVRIVSGPIPCTDAAFGSNPGGTAANRICSVRDISSGLDATNQQLAFEGRFVVRNAVCDADEALKRPDLCIAYPNGKYKPAGNIQKNSDRVRISAFGYLQQDGTGRYGGVMRAPLKYVGPKSFDSDFNELSGLNANREWDSQTGVFIQNPNAESEGISGVANYLNRFGRLNNADFGRYKGNDPVGELYYETIRYLQGQQPTSQAVTTLTTANRDGYPVYTNWIDPHPAITGNTDYSCLRNNVILIGDIGTHADKSFPGNSRTGADDFARTVLAGEPNAVSWTDVVSGFEKNMAVSYTDSMGRAQITSNPNTASVATLWGNNTTSLSAIDTGAGTAAYYMAGVAYWANIRDIRSDRAGMRVRTFAIDVNQNNSSGNDGTRRRSQFFLTGKYGGFDNRNSDGNPYSTFTNGTPDNTKWEGTPGEAKNYFKTDSPQGLLTSLTDIFDKIVEETGSIAGGAISSQKVTAAGSSAVYQAKFDPKRWGGSIEKVQVSLSSTTATTVDIGTVTWDAGDALRTRVSGNTTTGALGRTIFIGALENTSTVAAVPFTWSSLQTSHQSLLNVDPENGATDALGADRLLFLRGFRGKESPNGTFRRRNDVLGDVINSGLQYVGAPSKQITDPSYQTFFNTNKTRTPVIYAGANDGMLHAFRDSDGYELFAYIPSFLTNKLTALTYPKYTHQAYVDSTPVIGEAYINSDWKSVLVSGVGAGAQGVFALDVTDPTAFNASKVMWEFTDKNDANLGNVIGQPKIVKLRTAANGVAAPSYKWFAIFASGVNSHKNDGAFSTTGKPAIFILDLSKARSAAWELNTNYYRIDFPIYDTSKKVGMNGFDVTLGAAGQLERLYAGDYQGNLWRLDFTREGADNWTLDKLSMHQNNAGNAIPYFIAKDASGSVQPITGEPTVANGPAGQKIVMFGTGKFNEQGDITNSSYQAQTFYSLLDNNSTDRPRARSDLRSLSVDSTLTVSPTSSIIWGFNTPTQSPGWYLDFPNSTSTGERQISDLLVVDGNVYFSTILPATQGCGVGGGYVYEISILSGRGNASLSQVGILASPLLLEVGGTNLSDSDTTGLRQGSTRRVVLTQGSKGISKTPSYTSTSNLYSRLNWRMIPNFKEQKSMSAASY
jgi:type IV pilus assembly protein PilY1